jgi:hypothetical protein
MGVIEAIPESVPNGPKLHKLWPTWLSRLFFFACLIATTSLTVQVFGVDSLAL